MAVFTPPQEPLSMSATSAHGGIIPGISYTKVSFGDNAVRRSAIRLLDPVLGDNLWKGPFSLPDTLTESATLRVAFQESLPKTPPQVTDS